MKLYADEESSDRVRRQTHFVVSAVSRVEVPAALWRKHRMSELDATSTRTLVAAFEADYLGTDEAPPRFAAVALAAQVLEDAARLVATRELRAYDAVQLASARAARRADDSCSDFLCFDAALASAAAADGFDVDLSE